MLYLKKSIIFFGIAALLFSGCGIEKNKPEDNIREVSSENRFMGWGSSIEVKESGVIYEDAIIEFQDSVIEEMLRNMIGKPEGEVYISELQEIHAIYWRKDIGYWSNLQSPDGKVPYGAGTEGPWETKQPNSLVDLSYCYNLQSIAFAGIKVPSLKPLSDLPQLESLLFLGADVTEEVLMEVGELLGLKSITFGKMELSSLQFLCNLPQLEALAFEQTTVTEEVLADIGELPRIKKLEIGNGDGTKWGHLTDGSFLIPIADQLIEFRAEGGIDWNPEVMALMTKMETLSIHYADDLSFLEQMPKLKKLSLYCCCPKDWSPLGSLESLEHLEIRGNMNTSIDIDLDDLKLLTHLDFLELDLAYNKNDYSREEIIEAMPSLTGLVTLY